MTQENPENEGGGGLRTLRSSTRGRVSLVWAIPIVAVMLGASLVIQTYMAKGPTVEIGFPAAEGIQAGATPIKLLDVEIGVVQEVRLKDDRAGVVAVAELDPSAEHFLREGTVFWLVKPRVSLAGVSGIETLLSGQYIEVIPAAEGEYRSSFEGQLSPPIGARYPDGKLIVLETDRLGSIAQGTPIYHRGLPAGEVEHYELPEGDGPIRIYVMIAEAFKSRVRESTLFWNGSGIDVRVGLDGVEVRTEGLAAVLAAGIAFATLDMGARGASEGSVFPLYGSADDARESRSKAESLAVLLESRNGAGKSEGTPIHYRGLAIGRLGGSRLTSDAQAVRIEAFIERRFRPLVREGTRFFESSGVDVSLGLDGLRVRTESLRTVALGGISIAVPEGDRPPAEPGTVFALFEEPRDEWLRWKPSVALEELVVAGPAEHTLPPEPHAGALELTLVAADAKGLGPGSPVSYRSVPVGEVIRATLRVPEAGGAEAGEGVDIRIRIDAAHRRLVGSETLFWRVAAFSMDMGLDGLDLDVGSLLQLALGGIAFGNPSGPGERARYGARFALHADEDVALAELRDAEYLQLTLEASESDLREGAPVYFRRHQVGEVGRANLTGDARAVRIDLKIERKYASLVRENTRFWSPDAVNIQASLAGVEVEAAPIQALLAGGVMLATPSEGRPEARDGESFRLEAIAPAGWEHWHPDLSLPSGAPAEFVADPDEPKGVHMVLVATNVDSIGEGDPIFYRGLQIGELGASKLASDGASVLVDAVIAPEYAAVVRSNSQFWNASGFDLDVGWGGVEVDTGSLETLVRGGVQVATPDPAGERARSGDRFDLHAEPQEGWQDWSPVLR
jgi:paraquat-inducible protein B